MEETSEFVEDTVVGIEGHGSARSVSAVICCTTFPAFFEVASGGDALDGLKQARNGILVP